MDRIEQKLLFHEESDSLTLINCNDWNMVKRKEVRNLLLDGYVLDLAKKKKLE